jgi:DNA-binding GntR family transcriptional regulator
MSALGVTSFTPAPTNVELIADALREAIIKGQIPPGERIKEIPLARQLGVSRGPIREALRLLEHDGLVKIVPNRGAHVPKMTAADLLEVYAMRATLGSLALHKLMLERGKIPFAQLNRALGRFERAVARRDAPAAADADLAYQSAVVAASGLPRVTRQFEQLTWQVQIFICTMGIKFDDLLEQMLREVQELHGAIAGQSPGRAERLWREKFERWVCHFLDQMCEGFDRELWLALTSGTVERESDVPTFGQRSPGQLDHMQLRA